MIRLAPFIVANTEAILAAFEAFAKTIRPAANMDSLALRDHAGDILLATVRDMESNQTGPQPASETGGHPDGSDHAHQLSGASVEHAIGRLADGFNLTQLVSEYRALRISVLSLWQKNAPERDHQDDEDVNLFNESIDQSLAVAVSAYTQRVNESRDMFLAILSHDLRSPLASIAMSAQALPRTGELGPHLNQFASQISTGAKVMEKMISDLLDYTRTRLGAGMPIDRMPTDLKVLAMAVVDEFEAAHPESSITLRATGELVGEWDVDRLRQVISNLLGNAFQHGDRLRPITITLSGDASHVTFTINNQGEPIPVAEMTRIFDPLVRGAANKMPRQNRPGSIGLGLYIARELVLAHDGTIDVRSTHEAGTTFTFRLPRYARTVPDINPGASLSPACPASRASPASYRLEQRHSG